ncbi:MAG: ketoacyl-ACP synthase III [Verrucomicrobia bacterium]|nr:ketoacyl-ACP synthase III [Verrucomicrobiota bacterium]MBV8416165.1 ketoacyl-ACP synthase III [Verrucomicrobiota bacterium]
MISSPPHPHRSNKTGRTVSIVGTGSYVPERILTNRELEKIVETSDEWIRTRTGILERRIAAPDEATSDMATKAALLAMSQAEVEAEQIDLIIVATVTPDMFFPATACWVQKKLGAVRAACFDVSAACSGFLYAMEIAQQFISNHVYNTVLIIGADKLSSIVDWSDRNTCVLFGDGAGAAILRNRGESHGVIATHMGSDGEFSDILFMPGGGSRCPITSGNVDQKLNTIKMLGKETYKQAVTAMSDAADRALEAAGLKYDDIACVIPHQANMRIIEAIAHRMRLPIDKFYVNLEKYGNTSAAAVAIALDEAHRSGRFKIGDYILLVVFGGGLTWASSVIQW